MQHLPNTVLEERILPKLPGKSVGIFLTVCRSFARLAGDKRAFWAHQYAVRHQASIAAGTGETFWPPMTNRAPFDAFRAESRFEIGEPRTFAPSEGREGFTGASFCAGGGILCVQYYDNRARVQVVELRNAVTFEPTGFCVRLDEQTVWRTSPDASRGAGFVNRRLRMWSLPDGTETFNVDLDELDAVRHVNNVYIKFSSDSTYFMTYGFIPKMVLRRTSDASVLSRFSERTSRGFVTVHFSPDGHFLVVVDLDHGIQLWNVERPERPVLLAEHSQAGIIRVDFHPGGEFFLTHLAFQSHPFSMWSTSPPYGSTAIVSQEDLYVEAKFSPQGVLFAKPLSHAWQTMAYPESHTFKDLEIAGDEFEIAFSPNGTRVALTGDASTVICSLPDVLQLATIFKKEGARFGFSPDSEALVVCSRESIEVHRVP